MALEHILGKYLNYALERFINVYYLSQFPLLFLHIQNALLRELIDLMHLGRVSVLKWPMAFLGDVALDKCPHNLLYDCNVMRSYAQL